MNISPDGKLLAVAGGQEGSAGYGGFVRNVRDYPRGGPIGALPFQRSGADDALEQGPDSGFEQLDSLGQDESPLCAQCQGKCMSTVRLHLRPMELRTEAWAFQ